MEGREDERSSRVRPPPPSPPSASVAACGTGAHRSAHVSQLGRVDRQQQRWRMRPDLWGCGAGVRMGQHWGHYLRSLEVVTEQYRQYRHCKQYKQRMFRLGRGAKTDGGAGTWAQAQLLRAMSPNHPTV